MASQALLDCTIWVAQYDLTADVNQWDATEEYDELDVTTFGSGGNREYIAGPKKTMATLATFLNTASGRSEPAIRALLGSVNNLVTITHNGTANGSALIYRGLVGKVTKGGKIGEAMPLTASLTSNAAEGELNGYLIATKASRTSSANGTAYQNGAVGASQKVYGALHVFSASGTSPTLDVKIQSDDNSGMSSATDRITFTQATSAGAELQSLAGAITDDYWRAVWTIGGSSTPTFSFAVLMAIETTRS